jgi:hypothetical protein
MELITAASARDLVSTGVVDAATVAALPEGGYELRIRAGQVVRVLATKEGKQARRYRNIETAATHIRALGLNRAELDLVELALDRATQLTKGRQKRLPL